MRSIHTALLLKYQRNCRCWFSAILRMRLHYLAKESGQNRSTLLSHIKCLQLSRTSRLVNRASIWWSWKNGNERDGGFFYDQFSASTHFRERSQCFVWDLRFFFFFSMAIEHRQWTQAIYWKRKPVEISFKLEIWLKNFRAIYSSSFNEHLIACVFSSSLILFYGHDNKCHEWWQWFALYDPGVYKSCVLVSFVRLFVWFGRWHLASVLNQIKS